MQTCSFERQVYLPMDIILAKEMGLSLLEAHKARTNVVKQAVHCQDPAGSEEGSFELDLHLTMANLMNGLGCIFALDFEGTKCSLLREVSVSLTNL